MDCSLFAQVGPPFLNKAFSRISIVLCLYVDTADYEDSWTLSELSDTAGFDCLKTGVSLKDETRIVTLLVKCLAKMIPKKHFLMNKEKPRACHYRRPAVKLVEGALKNFSFQQVTNFSVICIFLYFSFYLYLFMLPPE